MAPGQSWHIGLNLLVPPVRGGRWLCGALIFGALYGFFTLTGVFDRGFADLLAGNRAAALFFCIIIAYIVPVFDYISDRTVAAIETLGPELGPGADPLDALRARVYRKPRKWFGTVLGIAIGTAIAHNAVLSLGDETHAGHVIASLAMKFGSALVWVIMTLAIAALIDNAMLLNRLARSVRLNPLDAGRLRPFALVAVLSTLALVGAQAAFPIMIMGEEFRAIAFVPGLLATMVPMVVLAVLPIWPLHRRLAAAKQTLLAEVGREIERAPPPGATPEAMATLVPLLAWRREILALPDWPFDVGIVGRLAIYLIIPPLTWAGAAVIQHFIEALL